ESCFFSGLCLEKRVFYRLISGFHSAITISIAAHNYKAPPAGFGAGTWFRNTEMFAGRFGTKWSWEGPQRLKNVYFVFLVELRALLKVGPYLQNELFYTGNEKEDVETRVAVDELLGIIRQFPDQFDENELFTVCLKKYSYLIKRVLVLDELSLRLKQYYLLRAHSFIVFASKF
ncbi:endoplasmic Reticulum Oxidoreductin 1, partial [Oesophagostomum dentatum]